MEKGKQVKKTDAKKENVKPASTNKQVAAKTSEKRGRKSASKSKSKGKDRSSKSKDNKKGAARSSKSRGQSKGSKFELE